MIEPERSLVRTSRRGCTPTLRSREARLAYLLVIPGLSVVLLIVLFPMIWNVVLSFQPVRLRDLGSINLFDFSHLSFDNYATGLDRRFRLALQTTLIYAVGSTALSILLGLWAALVARQEFPGRNVFRAMLLFPYVAPLVSLAFIWRLMLDKHVGIANAILTGFGGEPMAWLTTRSAPVSILGVEIGVPVALLTLILFEGWRYFPFAFLFILARLQAIPEDLYDAARVDGAAPTQRLRFITLPQLGTVMGTLVLVRFIWSFYKFADVFLLNGGASGTEVVSIQIYNWLFARRNIGVAAAIGVLLAIALIGLAGVYQRWLARRGDES